MSPEKILEHLVDLDVPQEQDMRDVAVRMFATVLVDAARDTVGKPPLGVTQVLIAILEDKQKVLFVADVLVAALKEL